MPLIWIFVSFFYCVLFMVYNLSVYLLCFGDYLIAFCVTGQRPPPILSRPHDPVLSVQSVRNLSVSSRHLRFGIPRRLLGGSWYHSVAAFAHTFLFIIRMSRRMILSRPRTSFDRYNDFSPTRGPCPCLLCKWKNRSVCRGVFGLELTCASWVHHF